MTKQKQPRRRRSQRTIVAEALAFARRAAEYAEHQEQRLLNVERALQTTLERMAQIQVEIDALKKRLGP